MNYMWSTALYFIYALLIGQLRVSLCAVFDDDINSIIRSLPLKQLPGNEIDNDWPEESMTEPLQRSVNGFSWKTCGQASDIGHVDSLTVGPDPIKLPGNVTVSFSGGLTSGLSSPLAAEIKLEKKVLFWIEIPCIDNVGSCSFDDICQIIQTLSCPPVFKKYGIPCKCPVKTGSYSVQGAQLYLNPKGIPSWAESGEYRATITVKQGTQQVLCLHVELALG